MSNPKYDMPLARNAEIANKLAGSVESLHDWWQDEKEYEDWADFKAHAKKLVEAQGAKFVHLKRKPFVLRFEKDGLFVDIECNVRELTVTQITKEKK